MAIDMFSTTGEEVAVEHLQNARKDCAKAIDLLNEIVDAIDRRNAKGSGAVSASWAQQLTNTVFGISNEIGRANGAVLVRVDMSQAED